MNFIRKYFKQSLTINISTIILLTFLTCNLFAASQGEAGNLVRGGILAGGGMLGPVVAPLLFEGGMVDPLLASVGGGVGAPANVFTGQAFMNRQLMPLGVMNSPLTTIAPASIQGGMATPIMVGPLTGQVAGPATTNMLGLTMPGPGTLGLGMSARLDISGPMVGMPNSMVGIPNPMGGMPYSMMGMPNPVMEMPYSVMGMPNPMMGIPNPMMGRPYPMMGMPYSMMGMPYSMMGRPNPMGGMPNPMVGSYPYETLFNPPPPPSTTFNANSQQLPSNEAQENYQGALSPSYDVEDYVIEVMFKKEARVRIRDGIIMDLNNYYDISSIEDLLLTYYNIHRNDCKWSRTCEPVPEADIDKMEMNGEQRTRKNLYNLNNIYRLYIPKGHNAWQISNELERSGVGGIRWARPVPKFLPTGAVENYVDYQYYLNLSDEDLSYPGMGAKFAWTQPGGAGLGVTVCDIEYDWNRDHLDLTQLQLASSNLNPTAIPPGNQENDHGTAVAGILASDKNLFGTTGICYESTLKTCGVYYPDPSSALPIGLGLVNPGTLNPAGALSMAINNLNPGDVILIEVH